MSESHLSIISPGSEGVKQINYNYLVNCLLWHNSWVVCNSWFIIYTDIQLSVDASGAGEGSMEITVSRHGNNIPNNAVAVGRNVYEVSFIGQQEGQHCVDVTYNGKHVEGEA